MVDVNDATSRTTRGDDPRRYEDDWRNREVGRSIPVAAETPKRAGGADGRTGGEGTLRPLRPLRARGSEATGSIGNPREVEVGRSFGATGIDARRRARRSTASRRTPSSPSPTKSPPRSPPPSPTTRWKPAETRFRRGDENSAPGDERSAPGTPPEVSSTADLVAVRGARDAMFRATYADVVSRAAAARVRPLRPLRPLRPFVRYDRRPRAPPRDVFVSAVASAATAPLVRCAAGKGGRTSRGARRF